MKSRLKKKKKALEVFPRENIFANCELSENERIWKAQGSL